MALMRFLTGAVFFCVAFATAAVAQQPALEQYYRQQPAQYEPPAAPQAPAPAQAEVPVAGSHVVTSVSKCFEELGPDESAEIKRNSLTPYADCQKRLRERAVEKKAVKNAPVEETPRNYKRVSDDEDDDAMPADSPRDKSGAAKPSKKK